MPQSSQASWSTSLRQAKQNLKRSNQTPLPTQKRWVLDEMKFYKQEVIKFAENRDQKKTEELFLKLIEARAKQAAIALEEIRREEGKVPVRIQKHIVQEYQKDCINLAVAIDSILDSTKNL